ncbi:DUF6301 family protein [Nocardia xishanensis]
MPISRARFGSPVSPRSSTGPGKSTTSNRSAPRVDGKIVEKEGRSPVIPTDLAVNRPLATINLWKRRMDYLSIYVTDAAAPDSIPLEDEPELEACFADLGRALTETLNAPTRHDVDKVLRWDLSEIVIRLRRGIGSVRLDLVGRQYQAELDEPDIEDDD